MNLKKLLLLAAIPALAITLPACGSKKAPAASNASASASAPAEVNAVDLVAEWRADPNAAVQKYGNKQIKINGLYERTVGGPPKTPNYSILLQGKNPANLEFVQVIVPKELEPSIKNLKKDDKLTVTCTLTENKFVPSCRNPKIEMK